MRNGVAGWTAALGLAVALQVFGCGGGDPAAPEDAAGQNVARDGAAPQQHLVDHDVLYPRVVLETTHGLITLELDAQRAPATVANFLQYVDEGHYDGTLFHQVEKGYVMLGGAFTESLAEKPAHEPIRNEAQNGLSNRRGTIAMARSPEEIDSSTCQFFINLADNAALDHRALDAQGWGYCVFGKVVEGWETIDHIAGIPVEASGDFPNLPTETVMVRAAKRLR